MDGGPRWVFDVWSAGRLQDSGLDEVVECGLEVFQWLSLSAGVPGRLVSCRECGVEEAWLCAGEAEVCLADGLEPELGACRCVRPRPDLAHSVGHPLSELFDGLLADRAKERVAVGEVSVGGVGNHPDHTRHLAQHDRVRTARTRELDTSLDERTAHSTAGPLPSAPRPIARLRVTCGPLIGCGHHPSLVDSVHNSGYSGQRPQPARPGGHHGEHCHPANPSTAGRRVGHGRRPARQRPRVVRVRSPPAV